MFSQAQTTIHVPCNTSWIGRVFLGSGQADLALPSAIGKMSSPAQR